MKPRTILILNYEFPPLGGGAAQATFNLVKEFSHMGIRAHIVSASDNVSSSEEIFPGILLHRVCVGKKGKKLHEQSFYTIALYAIRAFFKSRAILKNNPCDGCLAFFTVPSGVIAYLLGIPYIVSLRGSDVPFFNEKFTYLDTYVFSHIARFVWKRSRALVSNSEFLKDLALKTSPVSMIDVIPNGVDVDLFRPRSTSANFNILSTSRLTKRKQIDLLIRAFFRFSKIAPDARLLLGGEGDDEVRLRALVTELQIGHLVRFLGFIPRERMPFLYEGASVFVLPSKSEGMSNALLEAMASGIPVITSDTGDARVIVGAGGVVLNEVTPESLENALVYMYKNTEVRLSMQDSARNMSLSRPWSVSALMYTKIFSKVFK